MTVYGSLLILAALTMVGGLVAAWWSWSLWPVLGGLLGVFVIGTLASCAVLTDGSEQ